MVGAILELVPMGCDLEDEELLLDIAVEMSIAPEEAPPPSFNPSMFALKESRFHLQVQDPSFMVPQALPVLNAFRI